MEKHFILRWNFVELEKSVSLLQGLLNCCLTQRMSTGVLCWKHEETSSIEISHFSGKDVSSSWILTQTDMFSSFSRKQCDCWMTLNGFIHSFTSQVACLFLFDSGTLRKTWVKSAPCNIKTTSRAIVADCRMCACSVCFNERKRPSDLKLRSRMVL